LVFALWDFTDRFRKEYLMSTKTIGVILIVVGVIVLLVFLLADALGIGSDPTTIGWIQILGSAIGLVVAVVGIVLTTRKEKSSD
jgi:steroid 5-alpha reductase family enzyme